jgi:hypothetical protein
MNRRGRGVNVRKTRQHIDSARTRPDAATRAHEYCRCSMRTSKKKVRVKCVFDRVSWSK